MGVETFVLKDKEGVDCTSQFVSQRKIKENVVQKEWKDLPIDIRDLQLDEQEEKDQKKEKYSKQRYEKTADKQKGR